MKIDFDRYRERERSFQIRGLLFFVVGFIFIFASFWWMVLYIAAGIATHDAEFDIRFGAVFLGVTGIVPLSCGCLLVWTSLRLRTSWKHFYELSLLFQNNENPSESEIAKVLGLDEKRAKRVFFDACAAGMIVDPNRGIRALKVSEQGNPPNKSIREPSKGENNGPSIVKVNHLGIAKSPAKTLAGALLNNTYQIEDEIGAGSRGIVYSARQIRTGKRYAIKALLKDARMDVHAIKRFKQEATTLSSLGHPAIVQVHDFDVTQAGIHFLVMELLEGESLESRLGWRGSLPWAEIRTIVLQITDGLAAAHRAQILHRDLKPSNIFLSHVEDRPERVVLLDFGFAKPLESAEKSRITKPNEVVGTPMYMSPEMARGEEIDERADIYALGSILYEMVTGAPPFIEKNLATLYAKVLSEPPPQASSAAMTEIPAELDRILERALAKDPNDRYESVDMMRKEIRSLKDELNFHD